MREHRRPWLRRNAFQQFSVSIALRAALDEDPDTVDSIPRNRGQLRELPDQRLARPAKTQLSPRGFGVEALGIEADQSQPSDPIEHQNSPNGVRAVSANVPDRAPKCAIDRREVTESSEAYELSNVVETALAKALVLAAEAKRWDVVMRIAEELRRRRDPFVDALLFRNHVR